MLDKRTGFLQFILLPSNRDYFIAAPVIGILYFIILRNLYSVPSYYADSFTWIGAAKSGQPVTFRPIGYSKVLMFFHWITTSDIAIIAGQYFSNLFVNLYLFFTCTWLFKFNNTMKILLYALLIINPFYLFYSNYISSDAIFSCLAVLWFTLLIRILHNPMQIYIAAQIIVLAAAFEIRYNAIFFPAIASLVILLSAFTIRKKFISIFLTVGVVAFLYLATTYVTEKFIGTNTFSAFSGWQLANDALHVVQHDTIDTAQIKDKEVKRFLNFTVHFFDTAKQTFPGSGASAVFMWHINSPLKKYITVYGGKNVSYFKTWNALGPVYADFGKTVILQKPLSYFKHFVLPNSGAYFLPQSEIYSTYMEDRDTIPDVVMKYYKYRTNKVAKHHPTVYAAVFKPSKYLFTALNILLPIMALFYSASGKYKTQLRLYNKTLLVFMALYVANFLFIVLLAPTVFRYHVYIFTLSLPVSLYMFQQLMKPIKLNKR